MTVPGPGHGDGEVDLEALDRRIEEWKAERAARAARETRAPVWIAHHHAGHHDRCWRAGDTLVCRRCTLLWPLAFVVMAAVLAGDWWPVGADPWLLVLLPMPGVVEFLLEHAGAVRYQARRQLLLTVPVAVAIGRLFARYLDDRGDGVFWAVVWGYAVVMFAATVLGNRRGGARR
jgi:hypothetical protein